MKCAAKYCSKDVNRPKEEGVTFFKFPTQHNLLRIWLKFCQNDQKFRGGWRLCSDHFLPEDLEGQIATKLGFRARLKLKPGAIPQINNNTINDARLKRIAKREHKRIVEECLLNYSKLPEKSAENKVVKAAAPQPVEKSDMQPNTNNSMHRNYRKNKKFVEIFISEPKTQENINSFKSCSPIKEENNSTNDPLLPKEILFSQDKTASINHNSTNDATTNIESLDKETLLLKIKMLQIELNFYKIQNKRLRLKLLREGQKEQFKKLNLDFYLRETCVGNDK